jgi:cytochrome P450
VHLEVHVRRLLDQLSNAASGNTSVEVSELLLKMSSDFATEAIFGRSTDSLLFGQQGGTRSRDEELAMEFSEAANHAVHKLGQRGLMINLYWVIDGPKFRKSCRICKRYVSEFLTATQAGGEKRPTGEHSSSFMHSLLEKEKASPQIMRDQLLALLLASRDTSASFAAWVIYALARNKDVTTKLRNLINSHLPNRRLPTLADINAMPYLRYVLNETLRIYPVVPLDGRTATVDTVLPEGGGPDGRSPLLVPAGAKVGFNMFTMHHRRDIYGNDAQDFRPERWEEAGAQADFDGAFTPFIIGPRVCLGSKLFSSKMRRS